MGPKASLRSTVFMVRDVAIKMLQYSVNVNVMGAQKHNLVFNTHATLQSNRALNLKAPDNVGLLAKLVLK